MRILFRIIGGSHTIKSYSKLTPSNEVDVLDKTKTTIFLRLIAFGLVII